MLPGPEHRRRSGQLQEDDRTEDIKRDIKQGLPGWEIIVGRGSWKDILITNLPSEKNRKYMGKRINIGKT